MIKKILISIIVFFCFVENIYSQIENVAIDDVNAAYQLFGDGNCNSAFEYFTQMLIEYPNDPVYNYYGGVCFLFIDNNPAKAIEYLRFASTRNVPTEVFFYLAKAYQMNYEFDKAIKYYNRFKYNSNRMQIKKFDLENNIRIAENGRYLVQNVFLHKLNRVEKVKINNMYRKYNSKLKFGELIDSEKFVNSKYIDTNNIAYIFKHDTISQNEVFYFSMKNKKRGDKDIYSIVRVNDSTWSKPENLGEIINTAFDEDYPYLHSDGSTLYFASKGHYSMGGYDIYKSIWNWETNKWSEPISLNFPINSVNNDYLYIPYDNNLKADFVSDRNCKYDSVNLYNIDISDNTRIVENSEKLKEFADLFNSLYNEQNDNDIASNSSDNSAFDLSIGYDNTIETAIKYQLKADSLRWVIDDYKKKLRKESNERKQIYFNELINKLENEAEKYQKIADSNYNITQDIEKISFENHKDYDENKTNIENSKIANKNVKKKILKLSSENIIDDNSKNIGLEIRKDFYSEKNPIPINIDLPKGVVYIVQLGAYNNNVNSEVFKGLYPCVGFKKPNANITRYFAGSFYLYKDAVKALPKVKECGFYDAFIIAYENNNRVTIAIAKKNESKYKESYRNKENNLIDLNSINEDDKLYFEIHLQLTNNDSANFEIVKNSILKDYEIKKIRKSTKSIIRIGKFETYNKADIIRKKLNEYNIQDLEIHAFFYTK